MDINQNDSASHDHDFINEKGAKIRPLSLPSGTPVPVLGQGTWGMGEDSASRQAEIAALRLGLDLGMTLIDTAEMYGQGGSEELLAAAIAGRRAEAFLVSKVYPHNATRRGAVEACERSMQRLKTDYLDLYLLHWRGSTPLAQTLEAFQSLKRAGKIRDYGVSNFDQSDMKEASALPGGDEIVTNQVLYNLMRRGIEWDLLPWCRERDISIMAYSPLEHSPSEQRGMLDHPQLKLVASRHGATPAQVALAWLLRQEGIVVISKASNTAHVRENYAALALMLTDEDLRELDRAFPPPRKKMALEMR
jgi:Aldo/keto reductases, related to diketogulonate reductase